VGVLGMLLAACGPRAPTELEHARVEVTQASGGEAGIEAPGTVHRAAMALREAETRLEQEGDVEGARDLAYVASRRAAQAQAEARIAAAVRRQEQDYQAARAIAPRAPVAQAAPEALQGGGPVPPSTPSP
jgi:hypothetical protein